MWAAVRERYGPPEAIRLRDVALPVPAPTEVRVAVRATTVNRTDCAILRARPFLMRFVVGFARPRRPVLGTDFAGEVEAVGAEVTRFVPGDRVFGFEDDGASTQAEYCCIEAEASIARIPDGVDFETAAASIEGAHYAINFLNKVDLAPGADVLVNGATGAIGSALLQFAKLAAARVVAVCRAEHFDVVRSLGADAVLDYEHEAYSAGAPESYDCVFDTVGKSSFGAARRVLRRGGTYISSEFGRGMQNPLLAVATHFTRGRKVRFPMPLDIPRSLELVAARLADGSFRPLIDRRLSLSAVAEAYRYVESGQKVGNVVLVV